MRHFLKARLFDAEGGGGGGSPAPAAPAAPAASAPVAAAAPPSSAAAAPPAVAPSPAGTSPAAAPPTAAAGAGPYRPEGLPDHMFGATDNETIDNMKKALDGYRARDADQKIPEDPKAYGEFAGDIPEAIKPHIDTLKGDPLFDRVAQAATKLKLSVPQYQGMVTEVFAASAEMGILEPPIDTAAEKTALVPDVARHLPEAQQVAAREKRMNENFAYIDQAVTQGKDKGGLSKEAGEFAKAMLGDTARGHEFIEFLRAQGAGGHKGPAMNFATAPAGGDARADLARRAALPENTPGTSAYNRASHDQLMAEYQRLIPD